MHTDTKYCYSNNYHTITQENTKKTLWNLDNAIIKKTEIAVKNWQSTRSSIFEFERNQIDFLLQS